MKQKNNEDEIRFLVATDVHLGHKQTHQILKNDSFQGFDEVLSICRQKNVDFLLLGGDLFDEINPTQNSIYKCLQSLRNHVLGENQIKIKVKGLVTNFDDPNIKISLPIFTIHGNHDYPANDFGRISVCDLLHSTQYVNYFGKTLSLNKVSIKPICISKPNTSAKIAIYGLGYMKDSKLSQLFDKNDVIFQQPQQGKRQDYFCLFILHQNRFKGQKLGANISNCIKANQIPSWINLTIWCHQHESIPETREEFQRKIYQPGSTVITSYIEAEGKVKHAPLITINSKRECKIQPIFLLKSYRPMYVLHFQISKLIKEYGEKFNLQHFLDKVINQQIAFNQTNPQNKSKKIPILRLKIEYSGSEIISKSQFQVKYQKLVANPQKIFHFWKKKGIPKMKKNLVVQIEDELPRMKSKKGLSKNTQVDYMMKIFHNLKQSQKNNLYDAKEIQQGIKLTAQSFCTKKQLIGVYQTQKKQQLSVLSRQIKQYSQKTKQDNQNILRESFKELNQIIKMEEIEQKQIDNINYSNNYSAQTRILNSEQYKMKWAMFKQKMFDKVNSIGQTRENEKNQQKNENDKQKVQYLKEQGQIQNDKTKKNIKQKDLKNNTQKYSSYLHHQVEQNDQDCLVISSDQQPCCKKAEHAIYMEDITVNNFEKANKKLMNIQQKKKKNIQQNNKY